MSQTIFKQLRKEMRNFNQAKIDKQIEFILSLEEKNPKIFNRKFNWKYQSASNAFITSLKLNDNSITFNPEVIKLELRSFWSNIFTKDPLAHPNNSQAPWFKTKACSKWKSSLQDEFSIMSSITVEDIHNTINFMGKNKAAGPDEIPLEAFKYANKNILSQLASLFNNCLIEKNIPDTWKLAKIFLIHKGGDKSPSNFRPITLLNSIYKIFVTILSTRLNKIITKHNIIAEHQSGFQTGRSTASRICALLSLIKSQKSLNKNLLVLYLDIKKAYDSVAINQLVETLIMMGFDINFCELLKNIYSDSKAYISTPFGDTLPFDVTRGVKQGCPLSPSLFALFIEPLLTWLQESNLGIKVKNDYYTVGGFADYLVITTENIENLKIALNMTSDFLHKYRLDLNIDLSNKNKTIFTSFYNFNYSLKFNTLSSQLIEIPYISAEESYKYLGIHKIVNHM